MCTGESVGLDRPACEVIILVTLCVRVGGRGRVGVGENESTEALKLSILFIEHGDSARQNKQGVYCIASMIQHAACRSHIDTYIPSPTYQYTVQ